jgi:hypothetical protein
MSVDDVMARASRLPSLLLHYVTLLSQLVYRLWARVYSAYAAHSKRACPVGKLDQNWNRRVSK